MTAIASPGGLPRPWLALLLALGLCQAGAAQAVAGARALAAAPERTLSIATLSLAGDDPRWPQRRDGVLALLERLHPDVIALQDVLQTADIPNQACWLAARLGYGCTFITADPPSRPRRAGNALLTRRPVLADAVTLLHPFEMGGTAGMVQLDLDGMALDVYVTRLYPDDAGAPEDAAAIRAAQVRNLLSWIEVTSGDTPALLVGDMAAAPQATELRPFAAHYREAASTPVGAGEQIRVPRPLRTLSVQPISTDPAAGDAAHGLLATFALPGPPAPAAPPK